MRRINLIGLFLAVLFLNRCGGAVGSELEGGGVGTEETPTSAITDFKSDSISGASGNVAVDAGFAGNGTAISVPTGFTISQCKLTAAASNIAGSSISTYVSVNTTTGVVTCQKVVQEREEVPAETKGCVASYTMICVKNP